MKCNTCGRTPEEVGALYRQNAKGQPGIFACIRCAPKDQEVDPVVAEVLATIELANKPTKH